PPTPSAMSSPRLPVETVSISIFSRLPSFIAEPLPNARSIWASAASSAFCRSMPECCNLGLSTSLPMTLSCAAMFPVSFVNASGHSAYAGGRAPPSGRSMYTLCSVRTRGERKVLVWLRHEIFRGHVAAKPSISSRDRRPLPEHRESIRPDRRIVAGQRHRLHRPHEIPLEAIPLCRRAFGVIERFQCQSLRLIELARAKQPFDGGLRGVRRMGQDVGQKLCRFVLPAKRVQRAIFEPPDELPRIIAAVILGR